MQKQNKWNRSKQEKLIRYTYRQKKKHRDIFVIKKREEKDKKAQKPSRNHSHWRLGWVLVRVVETRVYCFLKLRLTSECNDPLYIDWSHENQSHHYIFHQSKDSIWFERVSFFSFLYFTQTLSHRPWYSYFFFVLFILSYFSSTTRTQTEKEEKSNPSE